jgi:AraC-like DNA-binding protein
MDETGRSRRYLTERFRRQVGVTPKTYARLLRFERTLELLRGRARDAPLGGIAATVGYYDQAHFDREFRSFAGCTPTEFLRESDPSPTVSFVQDIAG